MKILHKNDPIREEGEGNETVIWLSNYSWLTSTWTWTGTSYTDEVCEVPTAKAAWRYVYSEARYAERHEGLKNVHIVLDIR